MRPTAGFRGTSREYSIPEEELNAHLTLAMKYMDIGLAKSLQGDEK